MLSELIVSGLTHLSMPVLYGPSEDTTPVAMFGTLYVIIGAMVLFDARPALFAGLIFPLIGLIGASANFETSRIGPPTSGGTVRSFFSCHSVLRFVSLIAQE